MRPNRSSRVRSGGTISASGDAGHPDRDHPATALAGQEQRGRQRGDEDGAWRAVAELVADVLLQERRIEVSGPRDRPVGDGVVRAEPQMIQQRHRHDDDREPGPRERQPLGRDARAPAVAGPARRRRHRRDGGHRHRKAERVRGATSSPCDSAAQQRRAPGGPVEIERPEREVRRHGGHHRHQRIGGDLDRLGQHRRREDHQRPGEHRVPLAPDHAPGDEERRERKRAEEREGELRYELQRAKREKRARRGTDRAGHTSPTRDRRRPLPRAPAAR